MFPIANIDYIEAIDELKRLDYKAAVFLLYSEPESFVSNLLYDKFEELNNSSGRKIAFVTHYAKTEGLFEYALPAYIGQYEDWKRIQKTEYGDDNIKMSEDELAYRTMKNMARCFECGMENRLPCFVIFNPQDPRTFVEKSVKGVRDIFAEASHIITDIQSVDYDIKEYADKYDQDYYYLSSKELLEKNITAVTKGIPASLLFSVSRRRRADQFDEEYIPVWKLLNNLAEYIRDDDDYKWIMRLVDKKYLQMYHSRKDMMFPELSGYVELSSKDYLKTANSFYIGKSFDNSEINNSLIAMCLGKVLEDEMHLGVFSFFRGAYSISLPEYYDKFQKGISELEIAFRSVKSHKVKSIFFNKRKNKSSCRLNYPEISAIQRIAFDSDYEAKKQNERDCQQDARKELFEMKESLHLDMSPEVYAKLRIVSNARNDAVHKPKPINDLRLSHMMEAFQYLVDIGFFEVNHKLKSVKKN